MNKKNSVMTIDPGETTGICLIKDGLISFKEYKNNLTDLISLNRDRTNIDKDI